METVDWRPRKLRFQPERNKNIRGRVLVVTAVNDLLIQTNRTALQTCKAEEWTLVCPPCNFRRNHSNCSVIELCRTQSEAKHLREKLIKFDFRTQSNHSTTDALLYILQAVYEAVDSGEASARLFFTDFTKGFHFIDHTSDTRAGQTRDPSCPPEMDRGLPDQPVASS